MIYDELSSLSHYTSLIGELPAVLTLLESKQWAEAPVGNHTTNNPLITCELVAYTSSSEPRPYEVFRQKTRIHILFAGEELMALTWREHARSIGFDAEGKATLVADPIGVIHAKAGHFALFMPGEPHTVGMASSGDDPVVRKLLITISD